MKDFADISNSVGSWPSVTAQDCSGPGETDGTAIDADTMTDDFGWKQALLDRINETPNDTAESVSSSQILDALLSLIASNATWASNWEQQTPGSSYSGNFWDVALGEDSSGDPILVAVGTSGEIQYSYDGINWTSNTQGSADYFSVHFENGYWVACGDNGLLRYATDPTGTWTANNQGSSDLNAVYYGNGYWVVAGDGGTIYYNATNPIGSWTANNQGTANFEDLIYAGGYWVSCGVANNVRYTTDPTSGTWTLITPGSTGTILGITYGFGYWVILISYGQLAYTRNLAGSWTSVNPAFPDMDSPATWGKIAFGSGVFVAAYDESEAYSTGISISNTLDSWDIKMAPSSSSVRGIKYCGDRMIVVGGSGNILTSLRHG